jgi:ABC transport system ATP-binding/permease protein
VSQLEITEGSLSRSVPLDRAVLSVGSAPGCDVVLGATWIAPHHAQLESLAGGHRMVAEAGVLLQGQPVQDAMLHDGDVLRLPDDKTGSFVTLVYRNPEAPRIAAVQHFATPPGKAVLTIGRAEADIILDQPLVSRRHAELLWQDGRHVLADGGSPHGTFVNGERVSGTRPLAPGDVVQIGTFRLTYDGDSLDSFDGRRAIRLDALAIRRRAGSKILLHETTLSIEPCEFVALVGASGAGKSTLMMALCGFARADEGRVLINGDDLYAGYDSYRSIIGYVPQDDILHKALPVERALRYAAQLRLPADTAPEEIEARITKVLEDVEMAEHRHKLIDQLSGGQRKRVSIACELLAEPPLLFLDEPTSGLDPGLERKLMYTLRKLADGGRTVVLVTHATQNINQCDHIAFMSEGQVVWFGPPFQALEHFGVADFADVYTHTEGHAAAWRERFVTSLQHQKYAVERIGRSPAQPTVEQRAEKEQRRRRYALSSWRQFTIQTRRYLDLVLLDRRNLALLLLQAPVIGLLLLLVSRGDSLTGSRIEAKKLLFMLATTGVWFGVINAAREVCKEGAILRRERLAGLRAGPYLASKIVVLLGLVLVQSALLLGVLALRVRLPGAGVLAPAPLELFVTETLAGLAGLALGLGISVIATTPDKATSLIPIVLVPQVVFAGLMFKPQGATEVLSWLTASRWSVDAMGASTRLNDLQERILILPFEPQYASTPGKLLGAWAALLIHVTVCLTVAWFVLRGRRR